MVIAASLALCVPCPPACRSPFDRVIVRRLFSEGVKVSWSLLPSFRDPGPLSFALYFSNGGAHDDWELVGLPVDDTYEAIDPVQRDWGTVTRAKYRVTVQSALGTYESDPVWSSGLLDKRDWLKLREAVRQRRQIYRREAANRGYLLRRRYIGDACTTCADPQTGEPTDPACPSCFGTGYRCGYFFPADCTYAFLKPTERKIDQNVPRGTTEIVSRMADMLAVNLIDTDDIWVDARSDDRYSVDTISEVATIRGVAVAATVKLDVLPYSSPLYAIQIPERFGDILCPNPPCVAPRLLPTATSAASFRGR